jgi:hypothetical protein
MSARSLSETDRRVSTMIFVPATQAASVIEMVTIDQLDLRGALDRDVAP